MPIFYHQTIFLYYYYIIYINSHEFNDITRALSVVKIDYINQKPPTKHFILSEYPNVPNIRGA